MQMRHATRIKYQGRWTGVGRGRDLSRSFWICSLLLWTAASLAAQEPEQLTQADVVVYSIEGEINRAKMVLLKDRVEHLVSELGCRNLIFKLDTPGGELEASEDAAAFIYALDQRDVFTVAYIPENRYALSAGTLLAFACQRIVMADNTQIGDVAPVRDLGFTGIQELPEKIQTKVRNKLAYYAEARGYPVALAQAMVSKSLQVYRLAQPLRGKRYVTQEVLDTELELNPEFRARLNPEVIVPKGQILTLSERQAIEHGFITRTAASTDHLCADLGLTGNVWDVSEFDRFVPISYMDSSVLLFFDHGLVKFFLIVFGILALAFEFKMPGTFIPLGVGVLCFAIFYSTGFMLGKVHWIELTLFLVAGALIATEMFVIPGFGVAGFLGLACLCTSLALSLEPADREFTSGALFGAAAFVSGTMLVSGLGLVALLQFLPSVLPERNSTLIVNTTLTAARGIPGETGDEGYEGLADKQGIVTGDLRPAGKVEIEGKDYDVVAEGSFIVRGTAVQVCLIEGNRIVVRPTESS